MLFFVFHSVGKFYNFMKENTEIFLFKTDRNPTYPVSSWFFALGDLCPRVWPSGALSIDSYKQMMDAFMELCTAKISQDIQTDLGRKV